MISTAARGIFKARAMVPINSSLAAPSTGAAAIRTRKAPSCSPTISLREARGTTRTAKVAAPSFSENSIMEDRAPMPAHRLISGLEQSCRPALQQCSSHDRLQQPKNQKGNHWRDVEHRDRRNRPPERRQERFGCAGKKPHGAICIAHGKPDADDARENHQFIKTNQRVKQITHDCY